MDPIQIRQAIREVRELRSTILEKQLYQGYSGRARILGGTVALVASCIMTGWHGSDTVIFWGWGIVFILALLVNYGAIVWWHFQKRSNDYRKIAPLLEVFPVWLVAGVITLALYSRGQTDLLYGLWMAMFAIAQSIERSRLPRDLIWIGTYYLLAGIYFLFDANGTFTKPWLMGIVFFVGEWSAGIIMHVRGLNLSYAEFFGWKLRR